MTPRACGWIKQHDCIRILTFSLLHDTWLIKQMVFTLSSIFILCSPKWKWARVLSYRHVAVDLQTLSACAPHVKCKSAAVNTNGEEIGVIGSETQNKAGSSSLWTSLHDTHRHNLSHTQTHIHRMSHRLFACVQTCSLNSPGLIYLTPSVSCFMSCSTSDPQSTTTNLHTHVLHTNTHLLYCCCTCLTWVFGCVMFLQICRSDESQRIIQGAMMSLNNFYMHV